MNQPTFDEDIALLRRHGPVDVLASSEGARVAVSGHWQARVMTSTVEPGGASLGFLHRAFIASGPAGTPFDNYGGEDRFWLGPEAGPFGLFFPPGAPFELDAWQVPAALQEGQWPSRRDAGAIIFSRRIAFDNYSGFRFEVAIERAVRLLSAAQVQDRFGVAPPRARWVAFETVNTITNVGASPWRRETGCLSIWILGQFPTSPAARIVIPLADGPGAAVNDRYFGKVPPERLAVRERDGYLLFQGDGRHRSKIGVAPARTTSALGSYCEEGSLLTVVRYDKPAGPHDYVNSLWEEQSDAYGGDVVNSYNDGPVGGVGPIAPFYELETSSPAAALAPEESLTHTNTTLHVVGDPGVLDGLARATLGVPVGAMRL